MEKHVILGVHVIDRVKKVPDVQKILTQFGCNIKTRLGLHEVSGNICSPTGLLLLELCGPDAELEAMEKDLQSLEGVQVQKMVFTHS